MNNVIPTANEVRNRLRAIPLARMRAISEKVGVPFPTLMKIRYGETVNPQLDTVRLIWPELASVEEEAGQGGRH